MSPCDPRKRETCEFLHVGLYLRYGQFSYICLLTGYDVNSVSQPAWQEPLHIRFRFIFVITDDFCFWIMEERIEGGSCGRATSEVKEYLLSGCYPG